MWIVTESEPNWFAQLSHALWTSSVVVVFSNYQVSGFWLKHCVHLVVCARRPPTGCSAVQCQAAIHTSLRSSALGYITIQAVHPGRAHCSPRPPKYPSPCSYMECIIQMPLCVRSTRFNGCGGWRDEPVHTRVTFISRSNTIIEFG